MNLQRFNRLPAAEATEWLRPCADIDAWIHAVVAARPFRDRDSLLRVAEQAAQVWQAEDITRALAQHPRIGERASGQGREAQFSAGEQSAVNVDDEVLAQALREGNQRYESQFGNVFLIRAAGRDGHTILQALERRLRNTPQQEQRETAEQLREIALLRLQERLSDESD